jgi:exodeoxyribonuclease VII large subunit
LDIISAQQYAQESLRQRLERASPVWRIRSERQQLDEWQERGLRAVQNSFQLRRAHLQGMHNRLLALNPSSILQRGFSLVQRRDGTLIRSAGQAQIGEALEVRMWDGKLTTRVEQVQVEQQPRFNEIDGE